MVELGYLIIALIALSRVSVHIDRGHLNLSGLIVGASAILLNPIDATVVGLTVAIPMVRRGPWHVAANSVLTAAYASFGAVVAGQLRVGRASASANAHWCWQSLVC